jgi:hypothetical protein
MKKCFGEDLGSFRIFFHILFYPRFNFYKKKKARKAKEISKLGDLVVKSSSIIGMHRMVHGQQ